MYGCMYVCMLRADARFASSGGLGRGLPLGSCVLGRQLAASKESVLI